MRKLGAAHISIEMVKAKASKGRIYHEIRIKNCKAKLRPADILSEGELRIISLAAFLADVEGRQSKTPFVFDDPISSLDQAFEEKTVKRIMELCNYRQVIVFTHRLSLLALLQEICEKQKIGIKVVALQKEHWGAGEPREIPLLAQKPKQAINILLERTQKAKKTLETEGQAEYETIVKGICSDIRITIERLIENDLLCDVVHRFRRAINTQGKLENLAKITKEDCKFIEGYMTQYSRYEHSQPTDSPVAAPSPEQVKIDLEAIKIWRDEYEKRGVLIKNQT
jgi:hypothetical protein